MGGLALKSLQWLLRLIEFICAGIVLGIFSYFLATLHDHSLHIDNYVRAVEGISGAAALYLIFGLVLVWCLGGVAFFSFLGILLDLGFTGACKCFLFLDVLLDGIGRRGEGPRYL